MFVWKPGGLAEDSVECGVGWVIKVVWCAGGAMSLYCSSLKASV